VSEAILVGFFVVPGVGGGRGGGPFLSLFTLGKEEKKGRKESPVWEEEDSRHSPAVAPGLGGRKDTCLLAASVERGGKRRRRNLLRWTKGNTYLEIFIDCAGTRREERKKEGEEEESGIPLPSSLSLRGGKKEGGKKKEDGVTLREVKQRGGSSWPHRPEEEGGRGGGSDFYLFYPSRGKREGGN